MVASVKCFKQIVSECSLIEKRTDLLRLHRKSVSAFGRSFPFCPVAAADDGTCGHYELLGLQSNPSFGIIMLRYTKSNGTSHLAAPA